jgi:hypothetical protein
LKRICPHCRSPLAGQRKDATYCSDRCRIRAWDAAHPRLQKPLDFDPPPELVPLVNATVAPEAKSRLQRKAVAILRRLGEGPVDNLELPRIGGSRYGARIGEIRAFLRREHGAGPGWDPIKVEENKATGFAVYTLEGCE